LDRHRVYFSCGAILSPHLQSFSKVTYWPILNPSTVNMFNNLFASEQPHIGLPSRMDPYPYQYPLYTSSSVTFHSQATSAAFNLPPAEQTFPKVPTRDTAAPIRKQNRSCDQCRKGKRRCDAVVPREWPPFPGDAVSHPAPPSTSGELIMCLYATLQPAIAV
jgi:hypothetical protein